MNKLLSYGMVLLTTVAMAGAARSQTYTKPSELVEKVQQYQRTHINKKRRDTYHTITGFPNVDWVLPKGIPLGPVKLLAVKIEYKDSKSDGPSNKDQLRYSVKIRTKNGQEKTGRYLVKFKKNNDYEMKRLVRNGKKLKEAHIEKSDELSSVIRTIIGSALDVELFMQNLSSKTVLGE